jgi:pimeloyl-ACP methyl ester carboxylesterase
MNSSAKPVVVVHGVGTGSNRDRAKFSLALSELVDDPSNKVLRVGDFEDVLQIPIDFVGIPWAEALWESINDAVDVQTQIAIRSAYSGPKVEWIAAGVDMAVDVPLYLGSHGITIRELVSQTIRKHPNCVVVAHSLGSLIAFDVLREAQLLDNFASLPVSGLVTLGTPLGYLPKCHPFRPGDAPFPFPWKNLWYPKDPVCMGIALDSSKFPGVRDFPLDAAESRVFSHTTYWASNAVATSVRNLAKARKAP